jgi:hypothetical protein
VPKRDLADDEIMPILRTTVPRIEELTADLTDEQLHASPQPGEWSLAVVLAHLRACNDTLGGNMRRILTEDHPAWRAMSPRTWQTKSGYNEWQFRPAFDDFKIKRAELLELLDATPTENWSRTATVKVPPNKVYEYDVWYYADWLAGHERSHVRAMERQLRR